MPDTAWWPYWHLTLRKTQNTGAGHRTQAQQISGLFLSMKPRNNYKNKKVLLHEHKRHTACHVASTPYVVLTGYPPILTWPGGYVTWVPPQPGYPPGQCTPHPDLARGVGVPDLGTPSARVPPQPGYPPGQGTPLPGYPPWLDLAGYPPPLWLAHGILGNVAKHYGIWVTPPRCELTNKVKLLPSRRTTYAGGN